MAHSGKHACKSIPDIRSKASTWIGQALPVTTRGPLPTLRVGVVFGVAGESVPRGSEACPFVSAKSKPEHPAKKSRQNDRIILPPEQVRLIPEQVLEMLTEMADMLRNLRSPWTSHLGVRKTYMSLPLWTIMSLQSCLSTICCLASFAM